MTGANIGDYAGWSVEAESLHSSVRVTITVNVNPESVAGEGAHFTLYEMDLVVERGEAGSARIREWRQRLRLVTCTLQPEVAEGRLQFSVVLDKSLLPRASVTFGIPEQSGMPAFSASELILGELVPE